MGFSMDMEIIGYLLYGGLGFSIISFLFLMFGMIQKKTTGTMFDQAVNEDEEYEYEEDENEEDENEYEYVEEEYISEEKRKKNGLFSSFSRKNSSKKEKVVVEEEEVVDDSETNYNYEDEEEDEYANDFKLSYVEEDEEEFSNDMKDRMTYGDLNFDKFDTNDEEDDIIFDEGYKIKKYEDEDEIIANTKFNDEYDEEAEMLKRIQTYKDKFNKK